MARATIDGDAEHLKGDERHVSQGIQEGLKMAIRQESPLAPCPKCGQPTQCRTFRFEHETSDSARDTAILQQLERLGVELGAQVTVSSCIVCESVEAVFVYPKDRTPR
jgi:hypothetical protein